MNITLIRTAHKEIGKCNSDALCEILEKIKPDVIFLEALEETYTEYEKSLISFGVYHKRLEIEAIQKYASNVPFTYVPVLDNGLSEAFEKKSTLICENKEMQKMIDDLDSMTREHGFKFLNSLESIKLHDEMRMLEGHLLNDSELSKAADKDIDEYENSMIRNIYSYVLTPCSLDIFFKRV